MAVEGRRPASRHRVIAPSQASSAEIDEHEGLPRLDLGQASTLEIAPAEDAEAITVAAERLDECAVRLSRKVEHPEALVRGIEPIPYQAAEEEGVQIAPMGAIPGAGRRHEG